MTQSAPVGPPLKRCHRDQNTCLTFQLYDDSSVEVYDDAVLDGLRLRFPIEEVQQFIACTAMANPGYTIDDATNRRYVTLSSTHRIVSMFDPSTGGWVISERGFDDVVLAIKSADCRTFVVGTHDGSFDPIMLQGQLVS